jgi:hypothetical protein
MSKRIACINEAPIAPHERRIALDPPSSAPPNAWLRDQALARPGGAGAGAGGGGEFPLRGGHTPAY